MKLLFTTIGTVLTLCYVDSSLRAAKPGDLPPNFVILLSDDQSWVGSSVLMDPADERTRSDYFRTPHLERLAKRGMLFSQAYSPAPFCCPTRRSLLVGQSPARHIYQKDQKNWTTNYRKQLSLPQMLKQVNPAYRTAHFGKWDMRFDNVTPSEMGYDVSDGYTGNGTGGSKGTGGPAAKHDPKLIRSLTQRTCEFMEAQARSGKPFFVQVSHYAVHLDIFYSEDSLKQTKRLAEGKKHTMPEFAAMTRDLDAGIGSVMDKIESLGLKDNTYVFFLSDNGGRLTMPGQKNKKLPRNHPLRQGKGSMYEGGLRVPFIAVGPGVKPGGLSRVPVTGLDLFPTLAELAGHTKPLPKSLDGGSLTRLLRNQGQGAVQRSNSFLLFHQAVARSAQTALIQGDYKLVKTWRGNRLELFDLSKSVEEKINLSEKLPDKTGKLHGLMTGYLDKVGAETRKITTKKANQ